MVIMMFLNFEVCSWRIIGSIHNIMGNIIDVAVLTLTDAKWEIILLFRLVDSCTLENNLNTAKSVNII